MTSIPTGAVWRPYLRALAESGLDVAAVGAWVAAAELPPARRRLVRGAVAAVNAAAAVPAYRLGRAAGHTAAHAADPTTPSVGSGLPFVDAGITLPAAEPPDPAPRGRALLTGAVVAAALVTAVVAPVVAGRRLERRWLARLVRHGHPHPHRALGVRMAAVYAVMVVPGRLLAARPAARADRSR